MKKFREAFRPGAGSRLQCLTLCLAVSACASSPQQQFHTLVPPTASTLQSPDQSQRAASAFAVEVVPISVPEVVDRPQLVVRLEKTNNIRVLEQQQWAAPLQSELRNAVSAALIDDLGVRDVYNVDRPAIPVYRVAVTIQRFEASTGGASALHAAWSVRKPMTDELASCQTNVRFVRSGEINAVVAGFQQAVSVVAGSIAQVVRTFEQAEIPSCPSETRTLP